MLKYWSYCKKKVFLYWICAHDCIESDQKKKRSLNAVLNITVCNCVFNLNLLKCGSLKTDQQTETVTWLCVNHCAWCDMTGWLACGGDSTSDELMRLKWDYNPIRAACNLPEPGWRGWVMMGNEGTGPLSLSVSVFIQFVFQLWSYLITQMASVNRIRNIYL